jgi:hypothetical protein
MISIFKNRDRKETTETPKRLSFHGIRLVGDVSKETIAKGQAAINQIIKSHLSENKKRKQRNNDKTNRNEQWRPIHSRLRSQ